MPSMPKPVSVPPQWVEISAAELPGSRCSFGTQEWSPNPPWDPRLAIVYGRGRRLGEPLEGRRSPGLHSRSGSC